MALEKAAITKKNSSNLEEKTQASILCPMLPLEPNHYGEGGGNNEQISNMLLSYYVERSYSCLLR